MAHQQQQNFCLSVKNNFPKFFQNKWVLDIGSLDINGKVEDFLQQTENKEKNKCLSTTY